MDALYDLAKRGQLFTVLAAETGLSSGGWVLDCSQYIEFNMMDMELYMMAIEPQIQVWIDDVIAARKELSEACAPTS